MNARTNRIIIPLIVLFVLVTAAPTFAGQIIYVDDDGPADFNNIQAAINDSNDGDIIIVADGIYTGDGNRDIDLNGKAITLRSKTGPENCVINCQGSKSEPHRGFRFSSYETSKSIVDGFMILNGCSPTERVRGYDYEVGGAIFCHSSSPTIRNCIISNNDADYWGGGGIYCTYGSLIISNTIFEDNSGHHGGGILCDYSNILIDACIFNGNRAYSGGGIYIRYNCSATIVNSEITGHNRTGINCYKSKLTFDRCVIENNRGGGGGGVWASKSDVNFMNCLIAENYSTYYGGGIEFVGDWREKHSLTMTNCTVVGNGSGQKGGGVLATQHVDVIITNSILWNNTSGEGEQISLYATSHISGVSTAKLYYSLLDGGIEGVYPGYGGYKVIVENCLDADPCFVQPGYWDANGIWIDGDYHLLEDSTCIDMGEPNYIAEPDETDLGSNPRVARGRIDMGAYEAQYTSVIYVDDDAIGANDGSSWDNAFNYLQDALSAAWPGDEIRVAKGIYKPSEGYVPIPDFNWRTTTFQLINGVALKGGYAGAGTPDPNDRDIEFYETILSGDLAGNDGSNFANNGENSYHVVTGSGTDETAVLDGFTITAGNANAFEDNKGGGMCNSSSSPTVKNCVFSTNSATHGGGMYNWDNSNPTLTNCTFSNNSADRAGGMLNRRFSNPTLTNCTFTDNSATTLNGGGMDNLWVCRPTLTNCTFRRNSAAQYGGGLDNYLSSPTLTNCTFTDNSAEDGGGMYNRSESNPTLNNCTFTDNSAGYRGGGMYNNQSSPTLTNCTFSVNSAHAGGGMFNKDSSPTLLKCTFSGNSTSRVVFNESGGGMRNDNSHPKLTNCTFDRNLATDHGGGMFNYFSSKPTLINCRFIGNVAARQDGGGMFNGSGSRPTLTNCLFIGNIAKDGGGIRNWGADPTLVNCTFSENSASGNGGGVSSGVSWSKPKLTNCILWGNTDKDGVDESAQIYYGSPVVNYCCIQAWTGSLGGTGNIDADPCFVDTGYWDVNSVWVDGDYHLLPDSHCIDAGKPNYVPGPNETDLDGKPRIIGGRIDMGAYEFNHSPIADAGPDREVYAWTDGIAEVTLDGTNSYDDDGQPLTYYWNWTVDGNSYDANGVSPAIELPVGRHIIELIVNDGTDDSEPDLVTITAVPPMESQLRVFPQVIYRYSGMPKILAWVRLPEGVDKDQVDSDQPLLLYPAGSEAIHQHIFQHRRRGALQTNILAFFDKAELMEAVPGNGRAELQVVGQLQTGRYFYGSDTVWIIGWRRMPRRPFR